MLNLFKRKKGMNFARTVDEVEGAVFEVVRDLGFKRHGRTLHRFVSGDISQVIAFQYGRDAGLFINYGIRVPECHERVFHPVTDKKYYHEYECTLRSRSGTVSGKKESRYDLSRSKERIIGAIIKEIENVVLPVFDVLKDRKAILENREKYPLFDDFGATRLLDECMIYGNLGDMEKAKEAFERYYDAAVDEYNAAKNDGRKIYMRRGERIVFMGQDIRAKKRGYVTLYGTDRGHIDYLERLANDLGLR